MTNRSLRAIELFSSDLKISQDDLFKYKFDMEYSKQSAIAKYRDEILEANISQTDPIINEALKVLKDWDLKTNHFLF